MFWFPFGWLDVAADTNELIVHVIPVVGGVDVRLCVLDKFLHCLMMAWMMIFSSCLWIRWRALFFSRLGMLWYMLVQVERVSHWLLGGGGGGGLQLLTAASAVKMCVRWSLCGLGSQCPIINFQISGRFFKVTWTRNWWKEYCLVTLWIFMQLQQGGED